MIMCHNIPMNLLTRFKRYWTLRQFEKPTPLPRGMAEFNDWAQSIIEVYGLPDNDSVRWGLATMIMHLDVSKQKDDRVPKAYFAKLCWIGASKQVAGAVFVEIKEKAEAASKVASEPKPEVTQTQPVESSAAV